jgi:hypothetical protein
VCLPADRQRLIRPAARPGSGCPGPGRRSSRHPVRPRSP